ALFQLGELSQASAAFEIARVPPDLDVVTAHLTAKRWDAAARGLREIDRTHADRRDEPLQRVYACLENAIAARGKDASGAKARLADEAVQRYQACRVLYADLLDGHERDVALEL